MLPSTGIGDAALERPHGQHRVRQDDGTSSAPDRSRKSERVRRMSAGSRGRDFIAGHHRHPRGDARGPRPPASGPIPAAGRGPPRL